MSIQKGPVKSQTTGKNSSFRWTLVANKNFYIIKNYVDIIKYYKTSFLKTCCS